MWRPTRLGDQLTTRRARCLVLSVGLLVFAIKVGIASSTYGTEDIRTWGGFADGVAAHGPVGVYGVNFGFLNHTLYNHPPLIGYYLEVINKLASWGVPLKVSMRTISSAADVISGMLVLEMLRRRTTLLRAACSGLAVSASPLLLLVSGYHGNTDPVFLMLVLLGTYLILDRDMAAMGATCIALAVGIKLVPIVVIPALAMYVVHHRRDLLPRAAVGFGATVVLTWAPAVLQQWGSLRHNVLGYSGISERPWGVVRLTDDLGWSGVSDILIGPGKTLVVLACALLPAILVWRRQQLAMEAVSLSLVAFLTLTPAFGVQYLAWAVAASYLLEPWSATVYNLLGGLVLFQIYDRWNGGLPWSDIALGQVFTLSEIALATLLWASLVNVLAKGVMAVTSPQPSRQEALTAPPGRDLRPAEPEAVATGSG